MVIGRTVVGIYDGKDHDGKTYYFLCHRRAVRPADARRVTGDFGLPIEAAVATAPSPPGATRVPAVDGQGGGRRIRPAHADASWEMARKIWEWAEVGYQEKRSSALLADALESGGFRVERGVRGHPDGVHRHDRLGQAGDRHPGRIRRPAGPLAAGRARRGRPGPASTAGHGCGHHLFGVASAAGCLALAEQIKAGDAQGHAAVLRLPGRGRGAVPRRSWSARSCSTTATPCCTGTRRARTRPATARARRGSPRSSGSTGRARTPPRAPEAGRSALDAVELTNHAAELLREHTPDFTRIHHVITAGGERAQRRPRLRRGLLLHPPPAGRGRADALSASASSAPRPARWRPRRGWRPSTSAASSRSSPTRRSAASSRGEPRAAQRPEVRRRGGRVRRANPKTLEPAAAPLESLGRVVDRTGQRRQRLDRRGRRLVGRADGRVHDGLLGSRARRRTRGRRSPPAGTTIGRKGMILAARVLAATAWDLFQIPGSPRAPPGPSTAGASPATRTSRCWDQTRSRRSIIATRRARRPAVIASSGQRVRPACQ